MGLIKNSIVLISSIALLIVAVIAYIDEKSPERLIFIITTASSTLLSGITKLISRPRIELHRNISNYGRSPMGMTENNPDVIQVGVTRTEHYWELTWNYVLEIRNNSNHPAYNIIVSYKNLPAQVKIKGSFGKIEPLLSHEKREFRVSLSQMVVGDFKEADNYLKENADKLMKSTIISLVYKDENRSKYVTNYQWLLDSNKYRIRLF